MTRHPRHAALLAATTTLLLAAAAVPAGASSLVFVKDHNIWLSHPDGSKLTAVTTDGTADDPYRSPSQADDGTIAASHGQRIVRMRQNGEVMNEIDPPPLRTSVSTPIDGVPVSVAISPDGSKIAYEYATYNCPIGVECMGRSATGITWADRLTPANAFATTYFNHPRWVGGSRLIVGGGYLSHANLVDIAAGSQPSHWFDDQDYFAPSSDLGHSSVSRDGSWVVSVHGYDSEQETSKRLVWFRTTANPQTSPLPVAAPDGICSTAEVRGLSDPVWAPGAEQFAFTLPDGLHVTSRVPRASDACDSLDEALVIAGASEPDWGPADVNPQPRSSGGGDTPGGGTPPDTRTPGGGTATPGTGEPGTPAGRVALRGKPSWSAVRRTGLRLQLTGLPAGTKVAVRVSIDRATAKRSGLGRRETVIGRGSARTSRSGNASLTVRLPQAKAKRLARLRTVTITVRAAGAADRQVTLR